MTDKVKLPPLPNQVPTRIVLNNQLYSGFLCNWAQLNIIRKHLETQKKDLIYKGEGLSNNKEMYCLFKVSGKNGENYFVNNDVVFDFQKTGKPVKTRNKITEFNEKGA